MRITNDLLLRFLELKETIKAREVELNAIREAILASHGGQTKDCMAVVNFKQRRMVASIDEFNKKFGANWLQDNGMLYIINYKEVGVFRKPGKEKDRDF